MACSGGVRFALVVLIKYKAQLEVLCHFQPKFKWFGDLQIHESKKKGEKIQMQMSATTIKYNCKWICCFIHLLCNYCNTSHLVFSIS